MSDIRANAKSAMDSAKAEAKRLAEEKRRLSARLAAMVAAEACGAPSFAGSPEDVANAARSS